MGDAEGGPPATTQTRTHVQAAPLKRGSTLKSKRGVIADDALKAALEPARGIKPSSEVPKAALKGAVVKGMFEVKKPATKPKVTVPPITTVKPKVALSIPTTKPKVVATPAATEAEAAEAETETEAAEAETETEAADTGLLDLLEAQEAPPNLTGDVKVGDEFEEIATLIESEEKKDLYGTVVPETYIPHTRRGFAGFIKFQYKPYILPEGPIIAKPGDMLYPYQKFVRDYMRNASPYRGILVYHGLGSGKTCTAIAAAEALFATSKKNIIVLSPKSLKKNFLREVSKCGFRHFQLKNFWIKLPKQDQTAIFFANTVLGISVNYLKTAQNIWIPDFRKSQDESNYDSLSPEERQEIRAQILSIIEWDPVKNPTGRIRFISYNGISAQKLMIMACDPSHKKFFDDAVIVIDEVHNLIRNIHGTIEPYIIDIKEGVKGTRKLQPEPFTPDRWDPAIQMRKNLQLLLSETKEDRAARRMRKEKVELYNRGYMFYRLLCDARNSKIIGLSGTPLINHPEEIGILSNVLHGYFTIIEGFIDQTGKVVQEKARELALTHPFTDFVEAKLEPAGGTRVIVSLLPQGTIKISNSTGVTHIPNFTQTDAYTTMYAAISDLYEDGKTPAKEEAVGAVRSGYEETDFPPFEDVQRSILDLYLKNPMPSKKQISDTLVKVYAEAHSSTAIIKSLQKMFKSAGLEFRNPPEARAEPLLPPIADDYKTNGRAYKGFRTHFIPNKANLINKATLVTRLTGLISYYKGSSLDKMPRVQEDTVVRIPMSDYVQRSYSEKRVEELKKELEADKDQTVDKAWKAVFDMKDSKASNNFKMGSRQSCNFAFPPEVTRPRPANKSEEDIEALAGTEKDELVTLSEETPGQNDEFPELAEEEDEELVTTVAKEPMRGGSTPVPVGADAAEAAGAAEAAEAEAVQAGVESAEADAELAKAEATEAGIEATQAADVAADAASKEIGVACKIGRKAGEKMEVAIKRATDCFRDMNIAGKRLLLTGEDGLTNYSPKYVAMMERIAAAPGSSLVYSAFLNLEGIGLFRIAMDVNGYAAINIAIVGGQLSFTPETEKSLRLGPGKQPRYLTFSGAEDEQVRAAALSIFNAQFSDLPESMTKILTESGYTDNKVGELCRVFCITAAGAEGLSLRNVRAVHIMEPYWNEVRVRQVKGRAIRIGSHLDLAPEERNVSIYTYVSVFSDEAQSNKVPSKRIDQSILIHDNINAEVAKDMGIPLKPGMTSYVITTDEFFYSISERKRRVIEAVECILKSAAIDCEINIKQNKDETFMCLPLHGGISEYVYNPDLEIDILNVPQFEGIDVEKICTGENISTALTEKAKAAAAAKAAATAVQDIFKALKGVTYRMRPVMGPGGQIQRFDMYEADQADPRKKIPEKLLGTAGVKDGKPGAPVKMVAPSE